MPEAVYIRIGEAIRRKREARGMTQAALAAKVSLSRTSITNIEAGAQAIPLHQFLNISEALNAIPTELLPSSVQSQADATPSSATPEFEILLEKLAINRADSGS